MAVGLLYRVGSGLVYRAAQGLLRAAGAVCSCCVDPGTVEPLYALACPCGAFATAAFDPSVPADCQVPEGDCIYVDLRSILSDDPATLGERILDFWTYGTSGTGVEQLIYIGPVIIVGGVCYRFAYPNNLYADSATTYDERLASIVALLPDTGFPGGADAVDDLPVGATLAGGDGTTVDVASDCTEAAGCAAETLGLAFYEAFACDGSALGERVFVCAKVAFQGNVLESGCECIDRSVGYTAADVDAIELAGGPGSVTRIYAPGWLLAWTKGSTGFSRAPASSCCYCPSGDCLQGRRWSTFGTDDSKWWYEDVCCGVGDAMGYTVVLAYSRVVVLDYGGGDLATTTITCTISSTFYGPGSPIAVTGTITTRNQRPSMGIDTSSDSPVEIDLSPSCCLYPDFTDYQFPVVGTLAFPGPTFTDSWDGTTQVWGERSESTDPLGVMNDLGYNLRLAWNATPWAVAMQVASVTAGTDVYTGTGSCFGTCGVAQFRLEESVDDGAGRTESVSINLSVTKVEDDSAPCNWGGECGSGGWGLSASLLDLLP